MAKTIQIRSLEKGDLAAIVNMEERQTGIARPDYWEKRLEMLGVDPAYRRRGVAEELMEQFTESAEDHGIKTIFTLIDPNRSDLQHFFSKLGFEHGKMVHYQKDLSS